MPPAVIAGGLIGAGALGGALLSSKSQAKATKKATETQQETSDRAIALQREMYLKGLAFQKEVYKKGLELGKPFYDVGLTALPELEKAIRGGYDFTASPVAKYALETGGRELMRGLGARGLAGGGLAPYKLGELTSSIYASDYDRQIARLSGLVDIGRGTASGLTSLGQQYGTSASTLGQQYATTAGNINIRTGEDLASSILAQGRNQASLYQGMGEIPMNLATLYLLGGGKFGDGGKIKLHLT